MKVITVAGPKGGIGKSLTCTTLAVRATEETGRVALIDLNQDQATLTEWWTLRGRPANPFVYDADDTLDAMVDALRADGWDYCFIDGAPYDQDLIEMSVIVADAVLIPVKLSYFDASAIDSIIGMCRRRQTPFAFILNEFDDRKIFESANAIAIAMLEGRGTILDTHISYHPKYRLGQIEGKTGPELDVRGKQKGAIAKEIDRLWTEVKKLAGVTPAIKAVERGRG